MKQTTYNFETSNGFCIDGVGTTPEEAFKDAKLKLKLSIHTELTGSYAFYDKDGLVETGYFPFKIKEEDEACDSPCKECGKCHTLENLNPDDEPAREYYCDRCGCTEIDEKYNCFCCGDYLGGDDEKEEPQTNYNLTNDEVDIICEALELYAQLFHKMELKGNRDPLKSREIRDLRKKLFELKED
jgi:hypothetical protein